MSIFDYLKTMRHDVAVKYLKAEIERRERRSSYSKNWIITAYDRSQKKTMQLRSNPEGVGEKKNLRKT